MGGKPSLSSGSVENVQAPWPLHALQAIIYPKAKIMLHEWNWSDIVDPKAVERALAEQQERAERRKRATARGPANDLYTHHNHGAHEAA